MKLNVSNKRDANLILIMTNISVIVATIILSLVLVENGMTITTYLLNIRTTQNKNNSNSNSNLDPPQYLSTFCMVIYSLLLYYFCIIFFVDVFSSNNNSTNNINPTPMIFYTITQLIQQICLFSIRICNVWQFKLFIKTNHDYDNNTLIFKTLLLLFFICWIVSIPLVITNNHFLDSNSSSSGHGIIFNTITDLICLIEIILHLFIVLIFCKHIYKLLKYQNEINNNCNANINITKHGHNKNNNKNTKNNPKNNNSNINSKLDKIKINVTKQQTQLNLAFDQSQLLLKQFVLISVVMFSCLIISIADWSSLRFRLWFTNSRMTNTSAKLDIDTTSFCWFSILYGVLLMIIPTTLRLSLTFGDYHYYKYCQYCDSFCWNVCNSIAGTKSKNSTSKPDDRIGIGNDVTRPVATSTLKISLPDSQRYVFNNNNKKMFKKVKSLKLQNFGFDFGGDIDSFLSSFSLFLFVF